MAGQRESGGALGFQGGLLAGFIGQGTVWLVTWAPSSAHLQPRGEPMTEATREDPHEENDGGNY
jgi:hypothetical protein